MTQCRQKGHQIVIVSGIFLIVDQVDKPNRSGLIRLGTLVYYVSRVTNPRQAIHTRHLPIKHLDVALEFFRMTHASSRMLTADKEPICKCFADGRSRILLPRELVKPIFNVANGKLVV